MVEAKQRLTPLLSHQERAQLAWTMLRDVSRALMACQDADRIVVVTSDQGVMRYARGLGWDVVAERAQVSESQSVDFACSTLRAQGARAVLRIPADIPLVQPEDVDALLNLELASPAAALVPSRDGTGTNALLRLPPDLFPSRFGTDSFRLHQDEAQAAGVPLTVLDNPRIALDVDEADDLVCFWKLGRQTRTWETMKTMDLMARLMKRGHQAHAVP